MSTTDIINLLTKKENSKITHILNEAGELPGFNHPERHAGPRRC